MLHIMGDVLHVACENDIEIDSKQAGAIADKVIKKYDFSEYNEFILTLIKDSLKERSQEQ